jgi:hypothetical protein
VLLLRAVLPLLPLLLVLLAVAAWLVVPGLPNRMAPVVVSRRAWQAH